MQQHPRYTRDRIAQMVGRLQGRIYPEMVQVEDLEISPPVGRITHAQAQRLPYEPVRPGRQLGPLWTTFWFRGRVTVPSQWHGQQVDFLWETHGEATLWVGGRSIGGINPGRNEVPLDAELLAGGTLEFQVEVACNGLFGQDDRRYRTVEPYVLDRCAVARCDREAWELYYDLLVLAELEQQEDLEPDWRGHLLSELNRIANLLDEEDRGTWPAVRRLVVELYRHHNATYRHTLSAVGHAHIDTAWLWPMEETWRKCTRTFSTATLYMGLYPEYRFACPQAVQCYEVKQRNPDLYRRIKERFDAGQWVPVGGTWVEPDCNLPSGESLCRQFLFGQRFFQQEFGVRCREFWNPDVFGYNGQLPQIMRLAGIRYFLTQKLSWNRFNRPWHQTFTWQGIDGSEVLTHFPPADTYNSVATVPELRRLVREYRDNDRSGESYLLFGVGDGGGGPTRDMLERLRRARDLQGLPRTAVRSPAAFFERLERDCVDLPVVVGELYFEYHRGTYTTQAATKRGNRRCEGALHDAEFLCALMERLGRSPYPKEELDAAWRTLLVNQFHDILPGSSITPVYRDTEGDHARVLEQASRLRTQALAALGGSGALRPLNTTAFARAEVVARPDGELAWAEAPSYGIGRLAAAPRPVVLEQGEQLVRENGRLRAVLDREGALCSLVEQGSAREALAERGNRFLLYDDRPTAFDAWDIDPFALETAKECPAAEGWRVAQASELRAEVEFQRRVGRASTLTQRVRLDAGSGRLEFHTRVDWQESNRLLKVAFPVQVRAMNATYEMQFGHAERPTHYNTSFDLARFEVPGHRWSDLSEHGFGVALLTDSKYGYHTLGSTMHITLLRSSKSPDPQADMGTHEFAYAVYPHAGCWQDAGVVAQGWAFNAPLLWTEAGGEAVSYFALDDLNLVLDTVKRAEDSEALLLRLYEAHGARGTATLTVGLPFHSARQCNILEEEGEALPVQDGRVRIPYRPHQIIGLLLQ
ncbi:MAG: glycoside hydrolase family 38 C-terminal domain-containing protein [Candidatus Latescibacterota bacterium]